MKVKIIIEEVISQEFEVEVNDMDKIYDEIREKYLNEEIVVENPHLTEANVLVINEDNDEDNDWVKIFS